MASKHDQFIPLGHPHCWPTDTYDGLKCPRGTPDHFGMPHGAFGALQALPVLQT